MVALAGGDFAIVYDQFNGPAQVNLFAHTFHADGSSIKESLLSQNDRYGHEPSAIALPNGNFVVTMSNNDGVKQGLGYVNCSSDGTRTSRSIDYQDAYISYPHTAISDNGDYIVAYDQFTSQNDMYFDIHHADGTVFQTHRAIANSKSVTEINVAALDGGGFVIAWSNSTGNAIKARLIDQNGSQGPEIDLGRYQYNFAVSKQPGGGFVVTFVEGYSIRVETFDSSGTAIENFTLPNVGTSSKFDVSTTVLNDGRYLVQWTNANTNTVKAQILDTRTAGETWTSASATGGQHAGTIHGDHLNGGTGKDVLYGAAGQDFLSGGSNSDTLNGGADMDVIEGGAGADRLHGDSGWDTLSYEHSGSVDGMNGVTVSLLHPDWSGGNDAAGDLFDGFEAVLGSAFNDLLVGDKNGNVLDGGAGDDTLDGAGGADQMIGGEGFDRVTYWYNTPAGEGVTVDLSDNAKNGGAAAAEILTGIESVQGTDSADTLTGTDRGNGSGVELLGEGGNDAILGKAGADTLDGGSDDDTVEGGAGADRLHGGAGSDTLSYEHSGSVDGIHGVTASLLHPDWSGGNDAQGDVFDGFEDILGSAFNDLLVGDESGNLLDGGAGDDTLDGAGGGNRLIGGEGFDRVTYWYNGAPGQGVVVDLSNSAANGGAARGDVLVDIESVQGTDSADTLIGIDRGNGRGVELIGEGGADRLIGRGGNDTLNGGTGNDTLEGGAGADRMEGGAGNDTYVIDSAADQVVEATGGGIDTAIVSLDFRLDALANVEILRLADGTAATRASGGAGNDHLIGNTGFNILDGGAGADTMEGSAGSDVFMVDNAGDVTIEAVGGGVDAVQASVSYALSTEAEIEFLTALGSGDIALTGNGFANTLTGNQGSNALAAGGGDDRVLGLSGDDRLAGGTGNDRLLGGLGRDTLLGDVGNDMLAGGEGRDILTGGAGRDQFVFDTAVAQRRNANIDRITDFSVREGDKIVLENAIFRALGSKTGILNKAMFALDSAHDRSDHVVYNSHNGKLFYDVDGAGGHAAIQIAQLKAHLHLDYHSFVVV